MFHSDQKATGTAYTGTVALLIMAFVFCPAVLLASAPVSYAVLSMAVACSALCVVLAGVAWKKTSKLTIPSIAVQGRAK